MAQKNLIGENGGASANPATVITNQTSKSVSLEPIYCDIGHFDDTSSRSLTFHALNRPGESRKHAIKIIAQMRDHA